jgi:hypothetical protein
VSTPVANAPGAPGDEAASHQGPAVDIQPPLQPPNSQNKFFNWTTLQPCPLDPTDDIMDKKYLATLALYETVSVNISAQGVSIELEEITRLLRHLFHKDDFLAFFHSVSRSILLPLDDTDENFDKRRTVLNWVRG